jgi:hypothetical protein
MTGENVTISDGPSALKMKKIDSPRLVAARTSPEGR